MSYTYFIRLLLLGSMQMAICFASFIDVQQINPHIRVDLKYATADNFTKKVIYPEKARAYLLEHVARALDSIQKELELQGLGLLIWDAYRPLPCQWTLWNVCPDEKYVAHPSKGGYHTRGAAVDLTLVDLKTGAYVEMPTDFDDFSEKAGHDYQDISEQAKKNRAFLRAIMEKHGFVAYQNEWWHYNFHDIANYPPSSIAFDELELIS